MDASYVDLADPSHLEFDYMRWIRIVLRAARARRVVHVGGGACALARALAAEDPGGRQEVCEVDPEVLALAREHSGCGEPGAAVRVAEGADSSPDRRRELGRGRDRRVRGRDGAAPADHGAGAGRRGAGRAARAGQRARRPPARVRSARSGRGWPAAYPRVWALGVRTGNTVLAGGRWGAELDLDR